MVYNCEVSARFVQLRGLFLDHYALCFHSIMFVLKRDDVDVCESSRTKFGLGVFILTRACCHSLIGAFWRPRAVDLSLHFQSNV